MFWWKNTVFKVQLVATKSEYVISCKLLLPNQYINVTYNIMHSKDEKMPNQIITNVYRLSNLTQIQMTNKFLGFL